jgi:hypothetical protein
MPNLQSPIKYPIYPQNDANTRIKVFDILGKLTFDGVFSEYTKRTNFSLREFAVVFFYDELGNVIKVQKEFSKY